MDNQELNTHASNIVARAKAILLSPSTEWAKIATETDQPMQVFTRYAVPLVAIGPIASFIGGQVFGIGGFGFSFKPSFMSGLTTMITSYVLALVGVWLLAWVANFVSPKFGGRDDFPAAFRLVAYAMTAAWLVGIVGLIPMLGILALAGLYSLYLLYKGASPIMGVPQDKATGFTVVTVLAAIVAYIVIGAITAAIVGTNALASGALAGDSAVDSGEMTIDLGGLGRIEANEDGAVARFVDENGEEVTITVDNTQSE